jgi:malonate-semialdehyde dehydrogenase (acetylating)/methylmalonate-semialdehyde dehydrogenase
MFPLAIACGNTFVMKPSERDPGACMKLAELAHLAGIPPGVLAVVHGGRETVERLCTHPAVRAVSFVGSDIAGRRVHELATSHGKRAQCNLGAKNHAVVLEDADPKRTARSIVGAAFGAAGQRCMALSTVIVVGSKASAKLLPIIVEETKRVQAGRDFGPLVSPQARQRVLDLIASGEQEGARILVDGRSLQVSSDIS